MSSQSARPLVLIVEDDTDTRDMYSLYLDSSGLNVIAASNGDTAFALAVEQRPDVIVTDFMLPGESTGAGLCSRLRQDERTAHIPVLVLTGSSRQADTNAAVNAGCTRIRIKPYLPDELLDDIRQMLEQPRQQRRAG